MNETEQPSKDQQPPRMVTLVKCPTPGCNNGIRASRELFCPDCLAKHQQHSPETEV